MDDEVNDSEVVLLSSGSDEDLPEVRTYQRR
jgi:hypothetical protein